MSTSPTGIRTQDSRVAGGYPYHYATQECNSLALKALFYIKKLFLSEPTSKTLKNEYFPNGDSNLGLVRSRRVTLPLYYTRMQFFGFKSTL